MPATGEVMRGFNFLREPVLSRPTPDEDAQEYVKSHVFSEGSIMQFQEHPDFLSAITNYDRARLEWQQEQRETLNSLYDSLAGYEEEYDISTANFLASFNTTTQKDDINKFNWLLLARQISEMERHLAKDLESNNVRGFSVFNIQQLRSECLKTQFDEKLVTSVSEDTQEH